MVYIQNIRINDISRSGGKQVELGKKFLEAHEWFSGEFNVEINYCPISKNSNVQKQRINTKFKVRGDERGGDRAGIDCKEYSDGNIDGLAPLKRFFINSLKLSEPKGYFILEDIKNFNNKFNLYYLPEASTFDTFAAHFNQCVDLIGEILEEDFPSSISQPHQQIFYGAPGTGKSHAIEVATEGQDVIRTTFHPDSDYSTFVGAYKPTTKEIPMRDVTGKIIIENGKQVTENRIVYEFVSQAFLQAYVGAWEKFAANGDQPQPQYLVIEEINRGNCAQIFGDLFQLLDRNAAGFSEYPIKADADMKKQLNKLLAGLIIENAEAINALYKGKDVVSQVLDGDVLLLPSNLYIWATMNTSDQSLFPIDSAFKRRWDWRYVRIDDAHKGWKIEANGKRYDWWDFLERVNKLIGDTTSSEDKKLGYFFCKTTDGIITAETFVSKVVFYLWNDVFKDYEFEGDIFVDEDKASKLSFDKFYITDAVGQTVVNEAKVVVFLTNLGMEFDKPEGISDENGENDDEADVTDDGYKESINRIEFPDGTVITTDSLTQFDAFIEAMKKIGLEKVFTVADQLKYKRRNCPMLSLEKFEAIENDPGYSYVQVDNYYFVKGAKSYTYVRIIEDLSKMLDLNISVICKKPE